jgi:hypothetical protein
MSKSINFNTHKSQVWFNSQHNFPLHHNFVSIHNTRSLYICDAPGFLLASLVLMTESAKSNTIDIGQTLVNLGHHFKNLVNNH